MLREVCTHRQHTRANKHSLLLRLTRHRTSSNSLSPTLPHPPRTTLASHLPLLRAFTSHLRPIERLPGVEETMGARKVPKSRAEDPRQGPSRFQHLQPKRGCRSTILSKDMTTLLNSRHNRVRHYTTGTYPATRLFSWKPQRGSPKAQPSRSQCITGNRVTAQRCA